jgi:small subunit ribosomal protein S1
MEKEERKLSLGLKQLTADPWEGIEARFPVESRHKAKVRAFTTFGVFCELAEGIDGLVHISDLSWSKKIKHPSEFCAIGDEMEVVVLELDKDGRKISLGHKQVEENPWDVFESVFVEGTKHQGTIVKKEGNHSIVALPYGLEGFCLNKNLKKEDGSTAKVDDVLDFIVLEFNKNQRKIAVSHTQTWKPEEITASADAKPKRGGAKKEDNNSAVKQVNSQVEKSTLGDLDALAALKEKMEGDDNA